MTSTALQNWLKKLGYADEPRLLHLRGEDVPETHPYAPEIKTLLHPEGAIRAQAVFDVEGVPSVAFLAEESGKPLPAEALDALRQRVWNQNLVNVVIEIIGDEASVVPARKLRDAAEKLHISEARADGPFSALDVASANLLRRLPSWFDVNARVDNKLLDNLSIAIKKLGDDGLGRRIDPIRQRQLAELLMGQVLFLSYLEHRDIVGATYRKRREVGRLHDLVSDNDRGGVRHLIDWLRCDFNGDFLSDDRHDPWAALNTTGFDYLDQFLSRTDMKTGQGDFWNYDFSFIPVELLSGLYESFLSPEEQAKTGAYYTPRHLAMLAVDQAFAMSPNPLLETIFDGACGSGILLTTAYRRLIALRETRERRQLNFKERRDLLVRQIFGADINLMASRVSAFSLYLSLLEGLDPADIMEAQELENIKLPTLAGRNLLHGEDADFFKDTHGFARKQFSLFICNPPWGEPDGQSFTTADRWAKHANAPIVRRQIAGAFALRALDFLEDHGRLCLILPITQFLGGTSAKFVSALFRSVQPTRLINFGDLQNLLFPSAEHTCHVFLGERRLPEANRLIPFGETFDYCVPKADMSLAYGRLTMQSADRHQIQTVSVVEDPQLLVTLMWGDAKDLSLLTRLTMHGTLGDICGRTRKTHPWVCRKGVHLKDLSRTAVSASPLRDMPFVPVAALSAGSPVLHPTLLRVWDDEQSTVAGLDEELLSVFDGPRVLFPDGFSRGELCIRAVYFDKPASFSHSIGVIAGSENDARFLKFLAVYLRSSLAQYLMMMRAWKMLCERNALHLTDVESFPFFEPDQAPDPDSAERALQCAADLVDRLAALNELEQASAYAELRDALDDYVFDYFGVQEEERALVRETVEVLMPSIRPRSYASLNTPSQRPAKPSDLKHYARGLGQSLTIWRKRTGGKGRFVVSVVASNPRRAGPVGVIRIAYDRDHTLPAAVEILIDDELALAALSSLRERGLSAIPSGNALQLVPDAHIWIGGSLYLVRPMTRRSWTLRQALRDAEQIVREVQFRLRESNRPEVA